MDTLVFYGNNNLQKKGWNVQTNGFRTGTSNQVQSIPLARSDGSVVVNTRLESRTASIRGTINTNVASEFDNFQEAIKEFDQVINKTSKVERYLRFIPEYTILDSLDDATEWAGSGDTLSVTASGSRLQFGDSAIEFAIDVSQTPSHNATITGQLNDAIDLSSVDSTGNFEMSLHIPDTQYITDVSFIVGEDVSNYYFETFTANYEGLNFENGWNHFSLKWDSDTSETGTVDPSQIAYIQIQISYSSDAQDQTCLLGFLGWVDEERLRNFPVFRDGDLRRDNFNYNAVSGTINYEQAFENSKGYAISTHSEDLFSETGITVSDVTVDFDLDGSTTLLPLFNITAVTSSDVQDITITNLGDNRSIVYEQSGVADGQTIAFGGTGNTSVQLSSTLQGGPLEFKEGLIPTFKPGKNYVNLSVSTTTTSNLPASLPTANSTVDNVPTGSGKTYVAQSFVPVVSDTITTAEFFIDSFPPFGVNPNPNFYGWSVMDDSGGSPNSILASGNYTAVTGSNVVSVNVNVTSGSTYYLVLQAGRTVGIKYGVVYDSDNTDPYSGGLAYISDETTLDETFVNWTGVTGSDLKFQLTLQPSPGWDINFSGSYRKLFLA
jgi:hypothetical protein